MGFLKKVCEDKNGTKKIPCFNCKKLKEYTPYGINLPNYVYGKRELEEANTTLITNLETLINKIYAAINENTDV